MPVILTNSSYCALALGVLEGLRGGVGGHGPGDVDGHDAHGRPGQELDQGLAGRGAALMPRRGSAGGESEDQDNGQTRLRLFFSSLGPPVGFSSRYEILSARVPRRTIPLLAPAGQSRGLAMCLATGFVLL